MFIINPDQYSLPSYRIGPFTTSDIGLNASLPNSVASDQYFIDRFGNHQFVYTDNGRKAISLALGHYNLQQTDVVTIFTTTNNLYISGCVTKEIEKYCTWSREVTPTTKLIFVNHEFGYPYKELSSLKNYKLPIIEDCANSFYSTDADKSIGTVGDFVIYSFPKMFPIQAGGLLRINIPGFNNAAYAIDAELGQYIKNVLSNYLPEEEAIKAKRISNYLYLKNKFEALGFYPRFQLDEGIVPGVFMFNTGGEITDPGALKNFYYRNGVQCSVFYGEGAFYIPCHHKLAAADLDYFAGVMKAFLKQHKLV